MTRYKKLKSVGCVIDTYTLDILPLDKNDRIIFAERSDIRTATNEEFWEKLSQEELDIFHNSIENFQDKIKHFKLYK